jgi:hypothetical protein
MQYGIKLDTPYTQWSQVTWRQLVNVVYKRVQTALYMDKGYLRRGDDVHLFGYVSEYDVKPPTCRQKLRLGTATRSSSEAYGKPTDKDTFTQDTRIQVG